MLASLKRLTLGLLLIAGASALLLMSDLRSRAKPAVAHPAAVSPAAPATDNAIPPARNVRVALLQHASQLVLDQGRAGMLAALAERGWVKDQNLALKYYNAEGDLPVAQTIAKEMAGGGYDLLLTISTVSMQAVANANKDGKTPHVFGLVSDPYGAGVGISRENHLDHPAHLAGYGTMQPIALAFKTAREMNPALATVGVVWNAAESNSEAQVKVARKVCADLGIKLLESTVDNSAGVAEAASALIARGVDAIWLGGDVMVMTAVDSVIAAAKKGRIPVFTVIPPNAKRGALFDLGADYYEVGHLTGLLAADVLDGRKPATVPIDNVMPEVLTINQQSLAGLKDKWTISDAIVKRAQLVIDENGVEHAKAAAKTSAPAPTATNPMLKSPEPGRTYRIAFAAFSPEPSLESCQKGLLEGLAEFGFVEGRNLTVARTHAQGEMINIPQMVQNLDHTDADAIVAFSTPVLQSALTAVKTKPVVFTYVTDPLAAGAGKTYEDHAAHVTGIGSLPPIDDTIRIIRRVLPAVKKLGTLYNASEANSVKIISLLRESTQRAGLELVELTAASSNEVLQAAQALVARGVDAIYVPSDNTAYLAFDAIVKVSTSANLPLINDDPDYLDRGSLFVCGPGYYHSGKAAAPALARVLLGESPAGIPMANVSVNVTRFSPAAIARLGLKISPETIREIENEGTTAAAKTGAPKAAPAANPNPTGKKWNIAVMLYAENPHAEETLIGLRDRLKHSPLVEGRDYEIKVRSAQNDTSLLNGIFDAAITDGADLFVPFSTPTLQVAAQKVKDRPIVFSAVSSPSAAGVAKSFTDHLPNVTGICTIAPSAEILNVFQKYFPAYRHLGTIYAPGEAGSNELKEDFEAACKARGFTFEAVGVNSQGDLPDAALSLAMRPIDAIMQISDNVAFSGFGAIAKAARQTKKPLFTVNPTMIPQGAAVAIGRDFRNAGEACALLIERVIGGESPANIPISLPPKMEYLASEENARAVGLTLSPAFLSMIAAQKAAPAVVTRARPANPNPAGKKWKIAYVIYNETPPAEETLAGMKEQWKRSPLVEGRDYEIKLRSAQGDIASVSGIIDAALTDGADIIVPMSTPPLQVAVQKVKKTPIVFSLVANPMIVGAGKSFTDHLPNVTGISVLAPVEAALDLLQKHFPAYKRVGSLFCPAEANSVDLKNSLEVACKKRGLTLNVVAANTSSELPDAALALASRPIDAILQLSDNLSSGGFSAIAKAARQAQKPLISMNSTTVALGSAVSLGRDYHNGGEATTVLIERIIAGENPAQMPFELPPKIIYSASVANATAVGMTLPPALLQEIEARRAPPPAATSTLPVVPSKKAAVAPANPNPSGRKWNIAVVLYNETPPAEQTLAGMKAAWKRSALVEGRDYEIKLRSAQGDMPAISGLLDAAVTDGADLIVPLSTPTLQVAVQRVKGVPIVFGLVGDPMVAGAGKSYTDHLPSVTGITVLSPVAETLDMIQRHFPAYKRLGTLFCPAEANSVFLKGLLEEACQQRGLTLDTVAANTSSELPDAALALAERPIDAILQLSDNLSSSGFTAIARAARQTQKPLLSMSSTTVALGAAVALGRDYFNGGEATTAVIERIIAGESAAKIPFSLPPKIIYLASAANAAAVGMTLPPALLREVEASAANASPTSASAPKSTATPATPATPAAKPNPSGKKWKIATVLYNETPPAEEILKGMKAAWKRSALVEGRDYEIKLRSAQGDMALLNGIIDAALTDDADMIVTLSTPTLQIAAQKVKRVPVVFTLVTNPMTAGAGKSYTNHLPNVTGIAVLAPMEEALAMIQKHFPTYKHLGTLYCPAEANAVYLKEALEEACQRRGLTLDSVAANSASELSDAALALTSRPIDAILQIPDALSSAGFSAIAKAARQSQKPLLALNSTVVPLGAAVALGRDFHDAGEATVALIERIVHGEDTAKLPFALPPKVVYIASPANARAVGMTLPPALLKEVDKVVE